MAQISVRFKINSCGNELKSCAAKQKICESNRWILYTHHIGYRIVYSPGTCSGSVGYHIHDLYVQTDSLCTCDRDPFLPPLCPSQRLLYKHHQTYCILQGKTDILIRIFPILSYLILFWSDLSCPVLLSYLILSYLILSYPILSYPILSYPILSYPILSFPILSCFTIFDINFCMAL